MQAYRQLSSSTSTAGSFDAHVRCPFMLSKHQGVLAMAVYLGKSVALQREDMYVS